jgi:hypothetical protein
MNFTSSGVFVIRRPVIIALIATDFPVPVAPATNKIAGLFSLPKLSV